MNIKDQIRALLKDKPDLDIEKLINKPRKKTEKTSKVPMQLTFIGNAIYTCHTCRTAYIRSFDTNKRGLQQKYKVDSCPYCHAYLSTLQQDTLIDMILQDRKGFITC